MYKAYYRKYRPLNFSEVVGQSGIVTTLLSQINQNKVSHAYLFVGSRGTGKTTISKILARALNCEFKVNGNPCNTCENCLASLNDSAMDIVEMDAASNNGVDDIRELRENTKFPPAQGNYKVIIIDEVHMLSKGAFNALLKTLEEPPEYVVFILATTEPNKVPVTIISRCQRYEFKRIDEIAIGNHIGQILSENAITFEQSAVDYIAKLSDGGLRDALSLLEQCVAYSGNSLRLEDVISIVGTSNVEDCGVLINAISRSNYSEIINQLRACHNTGMEPILLLRNLIEFLQEVMKSLLLTNAISNSAISGPLLSSLSEQLTVVKAVDLLTKLLSLEMTLKASSFPWIVLESHLVKMAIEATATYQGQQLHAIPSAVQEKNMNSVVGSNAPLRSSSSHEKHRNVEETKTVSEGNASLPISAEIVDSKPLEMPISDDVELASIDLDMIINRWDQFLLAIKKRLVSTYALMREVKPISLANGVLKLYLNENLRILKHAIENEDNMSHIIASFHETFNVRVKVVIVDEIVDNNNDQAKVMEYFKAVVDPTNIKMK